MEIFCPNAKPLVALELNEVLFWLEIMRDHAILIRLGLPRDEPRLIRDADKYCKLFARLVNTARPGVNFNRLVTDSLHAVQSFFNFKRDLLHLLIECRLGGCLYPLLIDHMSREAMYFLKILGKADGADLEYPINAMTTENVFWLRIMDDHTRFIRGMLDPSERMRINQAEMMGERFDQLQYQSRDLDSMLWNFHPTRQFSRFQANVADAAERLVHWEEELRDQLSDCEVLSIIPPLLAEHVYREARHFLVVLGLIRDSLGPVTALVNTSGSDENTPDTPSYPNLIREDDEDDEED